MSARYPACADVSHSGGGSVAFVPAAVLKWRDIMPESKVVIRPGDTSCFKEAVCIDAERIYDSCSE
nr:MAG TPA: hypothetical protein [Caudoviricetes sp.]